MPVVRELVNRISFKINQADRKNAEDTFKRMQSGARGVISTAKGIGVAIAGAVALGAKSVIDFEKDTARLDFFVRNQEEAEELIKAFDRVANKSDIISQRQARAGAAIFSTLNLSTEQVQKLIPFLEKLSLARPDLGFVKIGEVLKSVVAGGDLEALQEIVPGLKEEIEKLGKTTFPATFAAITGEQRGEIILGLLEKSSQRINDLAKKQTETLVIEFGRLQKQTSDFSFRFGKEISEPLRDTVAIVRGLITELNKNEGFWLLVRDSANSTKEAIESAVKFINLVSEKGFFQAVTGVTSEEDHKELIDKIKREKLTPGELLKQIRDLLKGTGAFSLPETGGEPYKVPTFPGFPSQPAAPGFPSQPAAPSVGTTKPDQSINLNISSFDVTVRNESGFEISAMSSELTDKLSSKLSERFIEKSGLRDTLKTISASNGVHA